MPNVEMQVYDSCTLPLVREAPGDFPPVVNHKHAMNRAPSATRADVVRLIARFVQLEYSLRSTSGRLVVDETRLTRKRGGESIDLEESSAREILDAIYVATIRRAVYAPVKVPIFYDNKGDRLHNVIPAREVAQIVKGKARNAVSSEIDNAREWRATVSQKLSLIGRLRASALLEAEHLRIELKVLRNQLAAGRSAIGRHRAGGRDARNLRRHAEGRVAEMKSREQLLGDRLKTVVRTSNYRDGIEAMLIVCTKTQEIEAYCFGEAA